MKKLITIFISFVIVGLVNGQTVPKTKDIPKETNKVLIKEGNKTDTKTLAKEVANENGKTQLQKDTINKSKLPLVFSEPVSDSLFLETGKLKPFKKNVHASYYHDKFNGKKTASGKKFDNNKYTAAHKTLPFGTKVKVTNIASGKSVIVEVTDRGPFVKSREIDLSKRAFMEIAKNKGIGAMIVNIEIVEKK
jgi:rare lipoprotein A